ncbi:ureidoglycolate dehydrogenase [Paenibacillus macerans]|uniref:Ureidoglycolate dehydrogenase n=1 Tax=Paenibacillus macerans TaxID=44252 RepID=A0A090ZLQ6_PAEMA|nr:ureidoglycolate dehydrogenase [Paenibacillus macerans]KFN12324.1 ureidoglycolate dehydrogenase [Paenibacillus macerans]MCY7561251.1 ureidoglycolate dehydrogenase [Paenibacillus macerans]MEC0150183.1 ureidoglycolate dehydrogenase [Paenibacillus macerans]SUA84478.1 ureidoglycolate dehydrogenase [Paenibacillus macerans]GBK60277.1 ureidoglycolate dehydrogenase [Paenibacillus macerans]
MSNVEEEVVKVSGEHLHILIKNKLIKAGLKEEQAAETANHLVYADLCGIHSHGAVRVEYYAERIHKGGINIHPEFSFKQTGPSSAIFHGENAQGHYAANEALAPAIKMAKESGVAVVGVSRVGHTGTLSYYVRKIAEANLIGISMCQSDPMVVPYGGAETYYGTNPIAFGVPSNGADPLIFDMATTVQAWGKILDARSKGKSIPDTWAVDKNGAPTTDPNKVNGLLPIAGPKGYGLMMMVDILSGILLGLPFGKEVSSMYRNLHEGRNLGQLYIIIDPERFVGLELFKQSISRTMKELNEIRPAIGFDYVQYPGQGSHERYAKNLQEGVEIPESIISYLESDDIHYNRYEGLGAFAN